MSTKVANLIKQLTGEIGKIQVEKCANTKYDNTVKALPKPIKGKPVAPTPEKKAPVPTPASAVVVKASVPAPPAVVIASGAVTVPATGLEVNEEDTAGAKK